ncbi:MAG TPA: hypothetical protein VGL75_17775 [Acidothermaceae bacterium]|jgi:uncharacterized membrane protein
MSGDVENSQAARDAERAAGDLARALRAGAPGAELAELAAVKVRADERLDALRHRIEPVPQQRHYKRRRATLRTQPNAEESPDLTGETGRATEHDGNRKSAQ